MHYIALWQDKDLYALLWTRLKQHIQHFGGRALGTLRAGSKGRNVLSCFAAC